MKHIPHTHSVTHIQDPHTHSVTHIQNFCGMCPHWRVDLGYFNVRLMCIHTRTHCEANIYTHTHTMCPHCRVDVRLREHCECAMQRSVPSDTLMCPHCGHDSGNTNVRLMCIHTRTANVHTHTHTLCPHCRVGSGNIDVRPRQHCECAMQCSVPSASHCTYAMLPQPTLQRPLGLTLQHTATHCNTLQHTATHCNTLQHTATQRPLGLTSYLCANKGLQFARAWNA